MIVRVLPYRITAVHSTLRVRAVPLVVLRVDLAATVAARRSRAGARRSSACHASRARCPCGRTPARSGVKAPLSNLFTWPGTPDPTGGPTGERKRFRRARKESERAGDAGD